MITFNSYVPWVAMKIWHMLWTLKEIMFWTLQNVKNKDKDEKGENQKESLYDLF